MIITKVYRGSTPFVKGYKGNILLFEEGGGGLPSAYQEVEYIQTTSNNFETNYIDTGVEISTTISVWIDFYITDAFTDWGRLFGVNSSFEVLGQTSISSIGFRFANHSEGTSFDNGSRHTILMGPGQLTIDNVQIWTGTPEVVNLDTIRIFSSHEDRDGAYTLYRFKIFDNGVLIHDYVPCVRKSDDEPGLYDVIAQEFKMNEGTIPFIAGGNV